MFKKINTAVLAVCTIFVFAGFAAASEEKPDTPTDLKGGKVVALEEVKALVDKKEAILFDMRSPINYGKGHLPGATSLPYKEKSEWKPDFDSRKDEFNLAKLPADKKARMVFYSDGPKGWKSYKAAVLAIRAGYKNVMWFRSGSDLWEAQGHPMEQ